MNSISSVCVYCGSSPGNNPVYREQAIHLAVLLASNGIRLVNGGGSIGLMGIMADTILAHGGECIGVIPFGLKEKEIAHKGMTELIVVPDMHSRKLTMVNLSDAFIGLPGGFGTLDEVFETLTWSQLHLHHKPILLYNPAGYYDPLIAQADHMVREGFLNNSSRALLMSTDTIENIIPLLQTFTFTPAEKWTPSPAS
jgi:uncharacterized protein (TIGR00730 family)